MVLLVQEQDGRRTLELMNRRWAALVNMEGSGSPGVGQEVEEGEPPCPCCGTAAPLTKDGACSDCGLQLA